MHVRRWLGSAVLGTVVCSFAASAADARPSATAVPKPVPARGASDFLNTIGVATHVGSPNRPYVNTSLVKQRLAELGIRHVRDSVSIPLNPTDITDLGILAKAGIRFDFVSPLPMANTTADKGRI